jgi:hypothetical protein
LHRQVLQVACAWWLLAPELYLGVQQTCKLLTCWCCLVLPWQTAVAQAVLAAQAGLGWQGDVSPEALENYLGYGFYAVYMVVHVLLRLFKEQVCAGYCWSKLVLYSTCKCFAG